MVLIPKAFGRLPRNKKRLKTIEQSPNHYFGQFHNANVRAPIPYWQFFKILPGLLFGSRKYRAPHKALPVIYKHWDFEAEDKFWWAWLGHSSIVFNIDKQVVVIDPMLSKRPSPFKMLGPKRFHPAPEQITHLPKIDIAIISHDHYDHLDYHTIKQLKRKVKNFVVPLGLGEHLEFWGVSPKRIHELDWGQHINFEKVKVAATPAQHASGRWTGAENQTLWCSWVIKGSKESIFYSGDSGFFKEWADIGNHYGPFDLTFIQCAAYNRIWKYHHMTPAEVMETQKLIKGKVLVPVHWSTFDLATHKWYEPAAMIKRLAEEQNIKINFPYIGEQNFGAKTNQAPYWWEDYLPGR